MPTGKLDGRRRLGSVARTAAQARILAAALDLFAAHGVSGTSLQMIADAVGVTKAAVYHQFKTKEEIVIAVTDMELGRLEDALEAAEAEEDPLRARQVLLTRVIDMAVERRPDRPVVAHLVHKYGHRTAVVGRGPDAHLTGGTVRGGGVR